MASSVLGKAVSTPGAPAGPSTAVSDNVFDTSGWTVATGNGRTAAAMNPYLVGAGILAVTVLVAMWIKK